MEIKFNSVGLWALFRASGEKKKDFGNCIFGNGNRMGPEYFDNAKVVNFEHLARLCEHFHKEPAFFIVYTEDSESHDEYNDCSNVVTHNSVKGDLNIGKCDTDMLKLTIKNQQSLIRDKDEQIDWIKNQYNNLINILKNHEVK